MASNRFREVEKPNADVGNYVVSRAHWVVYREDGEPVMGDYGWCHGGHNPERVDWACIEGDIEGLDEPTTFSAVWLIPSTRRTLTHGNRCEVSLLAQTQLVRTDHSCRNCGDIWSDFDDDGQPPLCSFGVEG